MLRIQYECLKCKNIYLVTLIPIDSICHDCKEKEKDKEEMPEEYYKSIEGFDLPEGF